MGNNVLRRAAVLAVLACIPLLAGAAGPVRFARNAEVTLPAGYTHGFEDDGRTIVLYPPRKDLFQYRLTFHSLIQHLSQRSTIADDFVGSMARKKGKNLLLFGGQKHKGFVELGERSTVGSEPVRNLHGVVAIREGYATMTLSVPERNAGDPAVRAFLAEGMEGLVASLRYVDK
jgi:hypothetical protein